MRLMDSAVRLQRLIRLGIAVAGILLTAAAALLAFRKGQFDQLEIEYAALRQASFLIERYAEDGTVEELPAGVIGFGIYDGMGARILALGSAPQTIQPPEGGDELQHGDGQLRLLRSIGGNPMPGGPGSARGARRVAPGGLTGAASRSGLHYALLDYDTSGSLSRRRLENTALIGSGSLTAGVLVLIGLLFHRLRKAQQEQQDQARLARLGEAARTLAHEIRNPLTAAQMQTALLRRSTEPSQHGRLAIVDEELTRIRTLTDQVREFLQSGVGSPTELNPAEVAQSLAERLNYPVTVHLPERPVHILMDPERFRSVLTNLLDNAADASRAASTDPDPDGEFKEPLLVTVRQRRDQAEIIVADRGHGISAVNGDRVFDPFFTTKTHGSGVGLAVSRRFVEEAGGTLTIHRRDGGGTEMTIRLKGAGNASSDR
jgi:signal transduction histidine kinase